MRRISLYLLRMERTQIDFDPATLPKETFRHYIPASDAEIRNMLKTLGLDRLEDLFNHLPRAIRFAEAPTVAEELSYDELSERMAALAEKNRIVPSFIGDGLPVWKQPEITDHVLGLRELTTSYTPYQPERSQGTLISHWIYQCAMAALTGFEAVNASLYDRSTALYEAILCAVRMHRKSDSILVAGTLYPGDLEVIETLAGETGLVIETIGADPKSGTLDPEAVREKIQNRKEGLAALAFPQVNHFGLLEDVDSLTDLCREFSIRSIAVVDPMLLGEDGLKEPALFGEEGADIAVGEAQHLAMGPNFGGPGLGLFAVRYSETERNAIRNTPGRYVGKARDAAGRDCRVMVLSTREQHIRKEKATSNICSNQAFLATLAGAALLERGDEGMRYALIEAHERAVWLYRRLSQFEGVRPAFPGQPFHSEFVLELNREVKPFFRETLDSFGLLAGVDVSGRGGDGRSLLKISVSDQTSAEHLELIEAAFTKAFGPPDDEKDIGEVKIPETYQRKTAPGLPRFTFGDLAEYYSRLARLNIGPEQACYPLGSCTMKYNPYINDWAAGRKGFVEAHPQAPVETVQGCLETLYEIQEWFRGITGLPGVTTQPVAGAQGELVGLKMFQAYHRDRGESHRRVVLIPKSAHGTNFATAVMAGYRGTPNREPYGGVVLLEADAAGQVDLDDLDQKLEKYSPWLAGIMITNPNTGGQFETAFTKIAERVHRAGGLVYMDGANMNAIAGWIDLGAMGVDAVHNNLHKTWTIPHGGGGPGDAIVAVSERLLEYLPGEQVIRSENGFRFEKAKKSIGSFHRHHGNFAHKVRALTYLYRLGREGIPRMSAVSVLAARYLHEKLKGHFRTLPAGTEDAPRMHEFILGIEEADFQSLESVGIHRSQAIPRIGKLFLDFGYHAPTVAFPEVFGLMIEPTESFTLSELDRFCEATIAIRELIRDCPEVFVNAPHFTPIDRIDEVEANRSLCLSEPLHELPPLHENRRDPSELLRSPVGEIVSRLKEVAQSTLEPA